MKWSEFLWGRVTLAAATVGLAMASLFEGSERPWTWIYGLASFIILHALMSWSRERRLSNRLGYNYEDIQGRVLHLISDLSDLTAREFDLWMVDLYLIRSSVALSLQPPFLFKRTLVRELSLALTDVRVVPFEIELDHGLFGSCFTQCQTGLWWDVELAQLHVGDGNLWHKLDEHSNSKLRKIYGSVSVNPVVDALGRRCLGLLVVHTRHDFEITTKALGALGQSEGKRRLAGACRGIHSQLAKK